ncbi:MAG: hypothetical protein MR510_03430 [Clostridium sp.]|nr:hypothetical protein [Clostridium sp.]
MNNYQKLGIGFFIFAIIGFIITVGESFVAALIGGLVFCAPGLYFFRKTDNKLKAKKELKKSESDKREKMIKDEEAKKQYEKTHLNGIHQAGLPLAEGINCIIGYEEDKFRFNGGGNDFNLAFNKITDVCIKTSEEIHKQYVSSIGGAFAGNMLFGPLGAIVGGRVKEKKSTTLTEYLIFTYLKDEKVDYISFDVTSNWFKAQTLVDKFNKNEKVLSQGQTIEL